MDPALNSQPTEAARDLVPLIRELRDETEQHRRLAAPIVTQLIDRQLCRMALTEEQKGLAMAPPEMLDVYEILAGAEASVPWIAWNNSLVCYFSRFLGEGVRRALFADPSWLYAQSTRPSGTATVLDDGYCVRGRWALVSGCELAEWLLLLCQVEEDGRPRVDEFGQPETRFVFVRKGNYEILDTWYSGGLRGSGSHDVVVGDSFIAHDHSISLASESTIDAPLGRVPINCNLLAGFAAQILGVARSALDAVVETGRSQITPGPMPDLRDRAAAQVSVASFSAALEAARAHLHGCVAELWADVVAGGSPSLEAIGRVHAAALHADEVGRATVDSMYAIGGTSSLYTKSPLERAHRDLHAMLRHIVAQPVWLEEVGRVTFGLAPIHPLYAV